jgi:arginyl-tRNA synthetase
VSYTISVYTLMSLAPYQNAVSAAIAAVLRTDASRIATLFAKPKDASYGDFSLPCFAFAKESGMSPPACAAKIRSEICVPPSISEVKVVGPYLNFFVNREQFATDTISALLDDAWQDTLVTPQKKKLVLEYSGVNIAKPFHIGHLRTNLLGKSIEQLLKARGHEVVTINHLGDWGVQFGFVYAGARRFGISDTPSVHELLDVYRRASELKKEEAVKGVTEGGVTAEARDYFIRLEAGDPEAVAFWKKIVSVSMAYYGVMYNRLSIAFDSYAGESFYSDKLDGVRRQLEASGVLTESEGDLGVNLGGTLGFVRLISSDGRSLYIMRDIAAALYRYETYKPDAILYVVAAQQSLHFQQLRAVFEKMNHPVASLIHHISFGWVPGVGSRGGQFISVEKFLDDCTEHALQAYHTEVTKRPEGVNESEVSEKVALGALYFYFLNHSNNQDFQFTWEQAFNFKGDSGPYLQYAVGRLHSIVDKARDSGLSVEKNCLVSLLSEEEARMLVNILAEYKDVLIKYEATHEPQELSSYLLSLAREFARAYTTLRVIGVERALGIARLSLFDAVRRVLENGMQILGMPILQRM